MKGRPLRSSPATSAWLAYAIGVILQAMLLPCMCNDSAQKLAFAGAFDILMAVCLLVATRYGMAAWGWVFYAVVFLTSCVWIQVLPIIYGAWQANPN